MEGITSRRSWRVVGVCALASVLVLVLLRLGTEDASAYPAGERQVICLTEWGDEPTGVYRTRPHHCDLHERNTTAFHPTIAVTQRLHWLHWGGRIAVAKGKLGISTYGLAPLKLRLSKLREVCGHLVYTKAQLFVTVYYDGEAHHSRGSMPLDNCLR
jgi:hypothetical protein